MNTGSVNANGLTRFDKFENTKENLDILLIYESHGYKH